MGRKGTRGVARAQSRRPCRPRSTIGSAPRPSSQELQRQLDRGRRIEAFPLDVTPLAAPLPRAYQWADGSAYLSHVERVRRARGADMPAGLFTDPLMYQGSSDGFLGPTDPIALPDEAGAWTSRRRSR